jgi:hypothetical protein
MEGNRFWGCELCWNDLGWGPIMGFCDDSNESMDSVITRDFMNHWRQMLKGNALQSSVKVKIIYMHIILICSLNYFTAIYNFDTSVVNLEALQQIYEVVSISVILVVFQIHKIA